MSSPRPRFGTMLEFFIQEEPKSIQPMLNATQRPKMRDLALPLKWTKKAVLFPTKRMSQTAPPFQKKLQTKILKSRYHFPMPAPSQL